MSTVAFVALHYGRDYLGYAINSIYDQVDKVLIAYSDKPSHGQVSTLVNPDSRQDCVDAAYAFGDPQNKIEWIDGSWSAEGHQRDMVFERCPDADLICVIDADEIWYPDQFATTIDWCMRQSAWSYKQALFTLWRSFNWICEDQMMPDRFFRPKLPRGSINYVPVEISRYCHAGYGRSIADVRFKCSCHGHKNEWRADWFEEVYCKWSPQNNFGDLHPTCKDTWFAKPFDKMLLPPILRQHPYWNLDLIT